LFLQDKNPSLHFTELILKAQNQRKEKLRILANSKPAGCGSAEEGRSS